MNLYGNPPKIPENYFEYLRLMQSKMELLTGSLGGFGFGGLRIETNQYLPTERRVQFRFPRSKKVRIRKKWRKDPKNWHMVDARGDIYFVAGTGGALIHPVGYEKLKKSFGVIRNSKVE